MSTTPLVYAGNRYGKLVVMQVFKGNTGRPVAIVKCDCGNIREVIADNLRHGGTTSCGCKRQETNKQSPHYTKSGRRMFYPVRTKSGWSVYQSPLKHGKKDPKRIPCVEVLPDDPADLDEALDAARWLLESISLSDTHHGVGDRTAGEDAAIERLRKALEPKQ